MIMEMLAYFAWILFTISAVAFVLHILHLDKPRQVSIPVFKNDQP